MRAAQPFVLEADARRILESQARAFDTGTGVSAQPYRVVGARWLQNKEIAATLKVARRMVMLWRRRFLESGVVDHD
jgi:hypothetical protein